MTATEKPAKSKGPLDASQKQEVVYAIPLWLRDQNITAALARVPGRIQPVTEPRTERCAVVCFGPSLNDTWEQVRDFPVIISCSGSHKFLLERGIVPTYHCEVDPRPHKVLLIGPPHPEVEYLIASTCHPAVFDHLEGMHVKLWHVFDPGQEGLRSLPHGEWAVTGGCSVGVRALTLAGFLGFRDLHVFGMDGSEGPSGKHAAAHPNQPRDHRLCEYPEGSGQMWRTTPSMLEAARGTWHELDQMPQVRATFYGEGLVQAMAKDYTPKGKQTGKAFENVVGFIKPPLISPEYAALNAELHRTNAAYGVGGAKHAARIMQMVDEGAGIRSVLDYGSGKSELAKALPFGICEYDPAIPGKTDSPRPADLVVCTDVLEHVEPEMVNAVLEDLVRVTRQFGFFVINTGPAMKTLPDGRNTHVSQHPRAWWESKLAKRFRIAQVTERGHQVEFIVGKKP